MFLYHIYIYIIYICFVSIFAQTICFKLRVACLVVLVVSTINQSMGSQHACLAHSAPSDDMQMTPLSDKLRCRSLDDVVRTFDQFGCCIVPSAVAHCDLDSLARFMCSGGDGLGWDSRGPGRFCVNMPGRQLTDDPHYVPFTYSPVLAAVVEALVCDSLQGWMGPHMQWQRFKSGGDVVQPHTESWQLLHSDDWGYPLKSMCRGYSLCASVAPMDIPVALAPLRLIPWNVLRHYSHYPSSDFDDVPFQCTENLVTMRKGELLIRDSRVAHSGSPNLSQVVRPFPGMQIYTPQYLMWEYSQRYS